MICHLCPRDCGALREETTGEGFCRCGTLPRLARAALHYWEEPCISGAEGSGAVFFSGCPLHCIFCQNETISHEGWGKTVSVERLAEIFGELEEQGANNLNLVTPTHFIPAIRQALQMAKPGIPVVYNTGGYEKVSSLRQMEGLVQIYLPDLKYSSRRMAGLLSGAPDYPEVAEAALLEMRRQVGENVYDARGMLQRGMIVRHLVLPGMTADSMKILTWIRENLPGVPVSLMGQYMPVAGAAKVPGMDRTVTEREYARVLAHMEAIGLDGYRQERSAADAQYVPSFDGTGVCPR